MKTLAHPASALSETDLVAECRLGNPRAQRVLYDRLAPKMMAVCLRYVRHQEDAEEVLMQGFIKVFRSLESYRQDGCVMAWVRRIMANTALSYLRSKRPAHLELDDCLGYVAPVAARAESDLATGDLLRLIQNLPTGYRTVFNLYAIEGYTHPEIGALLGITEGTSKSQLAKARAQLQRQLKATQPSTTYYSEAYAA